MSWLVLKYVARKSNVKQGTRQKRLKYAKSVSLVKRLNGKKSNNLLKKARRLSQKTFAAAGGNF